MTPTAGCPHCSAPLTDTPACSRCGLRLVGPDAARLWQLEQHLAPLLHERGQLIARLLPAATSPRRQSRRSAQDVLLGTGGIALALAALVFAAWTYGALEPAGRCAALVVLALLAGGACAVALRRGLDATAECAAGVALVLGVTALAPARAAGLLGSDLVRPETWWAVGTAGVAVLAGGFAWALPTRAGRLGAVLLGHVSVLCLLARSDGPEAVAVVLAVVALLDAALARALPGLQRLLLAFATATGALALVAAIAADTSGTALEAALAYVVLGAAAVVGRGSGAVVPAWLLGAAAVQALVGPALGDGGRAATVGAVALVAALCADRLPPAHRKAALLLIAKAALLAAPADDSTAPGLLAALGLLGGALAAAALTRRSATPAWPAALAVLLAGTGAAALDLPAGDSRALLLVAVGIVAVAGSAVLPREAGRGAAGAGGAVALAGLWVGLSGHGVELTEAYTGPLALGLLAAGLLARRDTPAPGSTVAYGPGLAVLLLPSLLEATADPAGSVGRLLALVVLCAGVLLLGTSGRLRALVVAGSAGLVAAGLLLLVPYADAVPRWALLAVVGVLLTGVGATYEARRRDLDRARAALAMLS